MSQALVPTTPTTTTRSIVYIPVHGDPWPTIGAWAQKHRFLPREPQTGNVKLFQKGTGLFTAPMRAQFTLQGNQLELQAWLSIPLITRMMVLFLLPAEIGVQSGGLRAALPRSIARKAVNELLAQVGAPPIA